MVMSFIEKVGVYYEFLTNFSCSNLCEHVLGMGNKYTVKKVTNQTLPGRE